MFLTKPIVFQTAVNLSVGLISACGKTRESTVSRSIVISWFKFEHNICIYTAHSRDVTSLKHKNVTLSLMLINRSFSMSDFLC